MNYKFAVFEDEDPFIHELAVINSANDNARQMISTAARTEDDDMRRFFVDRYEHYLGIARRTEVKIRYVRRFGRDAYYENIDNRRRKELGYDI